MCNPCQNCPEERMRKYANRLYDMYRVGMLAIRPACKRMGVVMREVVQERIRGGVQVANMQQRSAIRVFEFQAQSGREVRVIDQNGDPWWVANDVCAVLGIRNVTQAVAQLDEDERSMFNIGRQGEVNIINEPGLYALILRSRKSEAKAFKRWITHEVLPQIRKTGVYATPAAQQELRSLIDEFRGSISKVAMGKLVVMLAGEMKHGDGGNIGAHAQMLLKRFLEESQLFEKNPLVLKCEIEEYFERWCLKNSIIPVSKAVITRAMKALGYAEGRKVDNLPTWKAA